MMSPQTTALATAASPDFRHIEAWVFDLDHTLYTVDAERHAVMAERICLYVQRHFGIARDPAWALQKRYLADYGSTLAGLVRHHGVDPDAYHDFVNDLDALQLAPDAPLRAALSRLSGRRLVFTNNCGRFAARVLERLGIADLITGIVDARAMAFVPKPAVRGYETVLAYAAVAGRHAAMFDDSPRNLKPAHELGMTTVWLKSGPAGWNAAADGPLPLPAHIHYEAGDLTTFLQTVRI